MKNIRFFYLKNFLFLVVKFSIYLNRRVFVLVYGLPSGLFALLDIIGGQCWVIVAIPEHLFLNTIKLTYILGIFGRK